MSISAAQLSMIRGLPLETLHELNTAIVTQIRHLNDRRIYEARAKFAVGDIVEFDSRKGRFGKVRIRITDFGPKNLMGEELDSRNFPTGRRWRVHPPLCRKVEVT